MESCSVKRPAASSRRLVSVLQRTPELTIRRSEVRSYGVPAAAARSSSASSGTANASPTIASSSTRSSWTAVHSAAGSSERCGRVTTRPPRSRTPRLKKKPVPCINGDAGRTTGGVPSRTCAAAAATTSAASRGTGTPARRYAEDTTPHTPPESQTTPLGRPVVPPVSSRIWSSGERSCRGIGGPVTASS